MMRPPDNSTSCMQYELFFRKRPLERRFHLETEHHRRVHPGLEHGVAELALAFRGIHGHVRPAQHVVGRVDIALAQCHPEAAANMPRLPLDQKRRGECALDALDDQFLAGFVDVFDHERKLVATETCNRVNRADRFRQAFGNGA